MESEVSLPHLQVPVTSPCLEPDRSSPCPTSHFLHIHLNFILPSTPGSSKWSLSPSFSHQNPVCTSPFPHTRTCYIPRSSHSSLFYHPNNILWGVQILFEWLITWYVFTVRSCLHRAQPPSWRTTPCRLSVITYAINSQLSFILEAVLPSSTWGRAMPWWKWPTYHGVSYTQFLNPTS